LGAVDVFFISGKDELFKALPAARAFIFVYWHYVLLKSFLIALKIFHQETKANLMPQFSD